MNMAGTADVGLFAAIGTIGSVGFVIAQLRQSVNQEVRELIAQYNMRYLEVAARIPYEILVEDAPLSKLRSDASIDEKEIYRALYDYFLLCEEQIRLVNERTHEDLNGLNRSIRLGVSMLIRDVRVWRNAISEWEDGMKDNFRRSAIREAFEHISKTLEDHGDDQPFSYIRKVID